MKNRLENDMQVNDLKFKILKDNEIVESLKGTGLSSENENGTKEQEDMENLVVSGPQAPSGFLSGEGCASCLVYADF